MPLIFLNGTTSSGKTSLALCLQQLLEEPYLRAGIDDAFAMLPERMHNHPDGFFFDRDERGLIRLNFGTFGLATLRAHHRAIAAIAISGVNLICDEVILTPLLRDEWLSVLRDIDTKFVGVHCALAELKRREKERGDRIIGQAEGQFEIVHIGMSYDVEVDTTGKSSAEIARKIIAALKL